MRPKIKKKKRLKEAARQWAAIRGRSTNKQKKKNVLIISFFSAVIVIMAGLGIAPKFISSSAVKSYIEKKFPPSFHGHIEMEDVQFFLIPYPSYQITGLAVYSNEGPFEGQPIATFQKVKGSFS